MSAVVLLIFAIVGVLVPRFFFFILGAILFVHILEGNTLVTNEDILHAFGDRTVSGQSIATPR